MLASFGNRFSRAALGTALCVVPVSFASAQQSGRYPVTVAIVDALPDSKAGAFILRQAGNTPADFILMTRESATARQLSAAVFTLLAVREVDGLIASRNATIRVPNREGPAAWIETEERRAEGVVRRLRNLPEHDVPGLGRARALRLALPVNALQGKLVQGTGRP
jgi:hypothetical protein